MTKATAAQGAQQPQLPTWAAVADIVPGLVVQTPWSNRNEIFQIEEVSDRFTVEIDGHPVQCVEWSGWITDLNTNTERYITGCRQDPVHGRVWLLADLRSLIAY